MRFHGSGIARAILLILILIVVTVFTSTGFFAQSLASPVERPAAELRRWQTDPAGPSVSSLDIARAVPYPVDFAEMTPDLGFLDGRFVSGDDQALRTVGSNIDDASLRGAKRQLLRAGWLRRYESRLAAPLASNPDQFGVQVSSFVVEYASSQDAANAFTTLAQESSATVDALVGDESVGLILAGTTPDTNTEYQAVKLVFRVGPLLCSMTYADLGGAQPSLDAVVTAGRLVAERARVVVEQGTVPLGSMVIQFTEEGDKRNDLYAIRAGVQTRLLAQSARESFALPRAASDVFVSRLVTAIASPRPDSAPVGSAQAVIEVEGETGSTPQPVTPTIAVPAPEVSLITALFSFNADSEAAEWLRVASVEAASGRNGVLAPIDAPPLGDESIAFQLSSSSQTAHSATGFLLLSRFGSIGIFQELQSSSGVSLEGAANVMRQQLSCIADAGCNGIAEVPNSVFGGRDVPIVVNLAPDQAQESVTPDLSEPGNESAPVTAEPLPAIESVPVASEDTPVDDALTDVPAELTEPEITSAPASEPTLEGEAPVNVPVESDPTPTTEPATETSPTMTPTAETSETPADSEIPPDSVAAETPVPATDETPITAGEEPSIAATETVPAEGTDAPAPESTAAPVPADEPIGAPVPPPANDVVQTPADSSTEAGAAPEFTEPVPAVTEPDASNNDGDRDSRRDRDRRRDRDGRGDKE